MENPLPTPVKKGFDASGIVTFIVMFIIVNALLDVLGNLVPIVPAIVTKPVTTVKALIASKTAPKA